MGGATRISAVPTLLERLRAIFASAARCATATASWAVAVATFMASEKVRGRREPSNTASKCLTLTHTLASVALFCLCFPLLRCVYMRVLACGGGEQVPRAPPVAGAADGSRGWRLRGRRGRLCECSCVLARAICHERHVSCTRVC